MSATRRRTTTKLLRLHPEELARIAARAEACGLRPARFIRETALGATPRARRHLDTDRLLRALAQLGGKLERAMRDARARGDTEHAGQVALLLDGHRALAAEVLALSAPHDPAAITTAPPAKTASRRRTPQRTPEHGRVAPLGDQLAINFDAVKPAAAR